MRCTQCDGYGEVRHAMDVGHLIQCFHCNGSRVEPSVPVRTPAAPPPRSQSRARSTNGSRGPGFDSPNWTNGSYPPTPVPVPTPPPRPVQDSYQDDFGREICVCCTIAVQHLSRAMSQLRPRDPQLSMDMGDVIEKFKNGKHVGHKVNLRAIGVTQTVDCKCCPPIILFFKGASQMLRGRGGEFKQIAAEFDLAALRFAAGEHLTANYEQIAGL